MATAVECVTWAEPGALAAIYRASSQHADIQDGGSASRTRGRSPSFTSRRGEPSPEKDYVAHPLIPLIPLIRSPLRSGCPVTRISAMRPVVVSSGVVLVGRAPRRQR